MGFFLQDGYTPNTSVVNLRLLCWLQDRVIYSNLGTVAEQDLFYLSPDSGTIVLKSSLQATTRSQYTVSDVTILPPAPSPLHPPDVAVAVCVLCVYFCPFKSGHCSTYDPGVGTDVDPGAGTDIDPGVGIDFDSGVGIDFDPGVGIDFDPGVGIDFDPGLGVHVDSGVGIDFDDPGVGIDFDPGVGVHADSGVGIDFDPGGV